MTLETLRLIHPLSSKPALSAIRSFSILDVNEAFWGLDESISASLNLEHEAQGHLFSRPSDCPVRSQAVTTPHGRKKRIL